MKSRLFRTADYILQPVYPCEPMSLTFRKLFLAEQARIVRLPPERVEINATGADIRLRLEGLASLVRDLSLVGIEDRRAA